MVGNNIKMQKNTKIQLFKKEKVRTIWDEDKQKWWFSIIDIVAILTEQSNYPKARKYWNKLSQRLKEEGNETVTNCHQLKMQAEDGKMRLTDVADTEQILRLIQSIPSKKAEPFKMWLAKVGNERIDEMQDLVETQNLASLRTAFNQTNVKKLNFVELDLCGMTIRHGTPLLR